MTTVHKRHRLKGYDYSNPGYYFITVCIRQNILRHQPHPLGTIHHAEVTLSPAGQITRQVWEQLPDHFPNLVPDAFCIMPNHIHFILNLVIPAGYEEFGSTAMKMHPVSRMVGALKSFTTREINRIHHTPRQPFWQMNYYDHVIRHERALQAIRNYIIGNPYRWEKDPYYSR